MAVKPDWNRLRHAYGKASDVPAMLDGLHGDPAARVAACTQLASALVHQDTLYSASAHAVPYVLAAIAGPAADRVLALIAGFAIGDASLVLARGVDRSAMYRALAASHRAVATGARDHVVPCLGDARAEVRAWAAYVIGLLPDVDARTELEAALARERDAPPAASLVLALGLSARHAGAPLAIDAGTGGAGASLDDPIVGAALAIARGWQRDDDAHATEALRAVAQEHVADPRVPWNSGDLSSLARLVLIARVEADPDAKADALVAAIAPGPQLEAALWSAASQLMPGDRLTLATALPPGARRLCERAAALPAPFRTTIAPYQTDFGCDARADLRRYLELDPAGPYETQTAAAHTEPAPLWYWLNAYASQREPAATLTAALAAAPCEAAVEAALAAARYPHGLAGSHAQHDPQALLDALLAGIAAFGDRAEPALGAGVGRIRLTGARHFDALLAVAALDAIAAARDEALDPALDPLLARPLAGNVPQPVRAILARMPEPRREALILACPPSVGSLGGELFLAGGWRYYDLCLTAPVLRAIIAHVVAFDGTRKRNALRDARAVELLHAGVSLVRSELEAAARSDAQRRDLFAAALAVS